MKSTENKSVPPLAPENRFIRATHKNGEVRSDIQASATDGDTWILHMLDSENELTFDELVTNVHAYNKQEKEKPQDRMSIAFGLIRLIEADMVKLVHYEKRVL